MSEPTEDLEVVLDDPKDPAGTPPEAKADTPPAPGLEELKAQLIASQEAQKASDRRASEAMAIAQRARTSAHESDIQAVATAIETVKGNENALKAAYAEAAAVGDWAATADLQMEMAKNAARLMQLEEGKTRLEAAPPKPEPISDPVEQIASTLTAKSAAWVRAHPDYVLDADKNVALLAAHNLAVRHHRHAIDTEAYFASVEQTLGISLPGERPRAKVADDDAEDESALSGAAVARGRDAPPPAAPPSRANGKTTIRLSSDEIEAAKDSGLTPEQYAKNKADLKKEGKLN